MLRVALSPKSDMSISDLRVALFNYILSKQKNEGLIIRIEDIDSPKDIKSQSKEILEILNLFSIDYSQIMYQSENLKYHQKFAMQLLTQNASKIYSNEDIANRYKGYKESIDIQNIRKLVSKLRKKLPQNSLESIYGIGYRIIPFIA